MQDARCFTHIYTARRVAELLLSSEFADWPGLGGNELLAKYDPKFWLPCRGHGSDWSVTTGA